ncbi:MAG: toxin [Deltaproteobacteria bacterium]|nr:toxin [Deltaproteobacteria bacterium]
MRLRYSEARIGAQTHTLDPDALAQLPLGIDGDEYRFVDLDGEGLPGIVAQRGDVLCYMPPLGDGRYGALAPVASQVSAARLGQDAQLVDLDGDGRLELTVMDEGYHARTASGEWGPWRSFTAVPTIPWSDPQLRQLDLDGDGLPDLLLTEADHFVWVPSRGAEGWGAPVHLPKPGDERAGPAVVFDDAAGRIVLADMTGDGLQDIVRIEHAAVHYWPNLGLGRFGRRVTMDGDPFFAADDEFDARRVRLGDIDGSGTTDLVVLDERGARVWFNRSGNGWSPPQRITAFPGVAVTTAVELIDVRGTGTSCLVWSEAADWAKPLPVRYVELALEKPHLLVEVDNGVGLVTRLAYEPSTAQYLRDRAAGRPWVTRLPFPVQVVTRIETADLVAGRRFVQRFAYHHGYYDGVEREMRGFAAVDRWDTEAFDADGDDALFELALFDIVESALHQPPVHTRSWFHTGAYPGGVSLAEQLAREYFAGDPAAWTLPDTVMPAGLDLDDAREAARALRGRLLHEEIYAQDGSDREGLPYTVTEANHAVRVVQARGERKHAVVFVHERERLSYHYERDVDDPRISHALVLDVDAYGDVLRAADVGYPRRGVVGTLPEQLRRAVVIRESSFAAFDVAGEPDAYRASVPVESRSYELLGADDDGAPVQLATLRSVVDAAQRDAPEAADPVDGAAHLRLLGAQRTFYAQDDGEAPRGLGDCGPLALVREVHAAAFSDGQRTAMYGADVDDGLLAGAGYVADDGLWWARSARARYDATQFFLTEAVFSPFGDPPTTIVYDDHALFPIAFTDALGNVVTATHDYRVLAPTMLTDANGNRSAAGFDARGMVVWTAVMGKAGLGEGDTPDDPTTRFAYDLFAWRDRGEPNFTHASARERHGDPTTRWLERRVYSDGSGRVLLEKASAEPGLAPQRDADGALVVVDGATVDAFASPRWIGSGRTVFDNKGNPVRQYEPYFSATLAYESEAELRERGVTAVLHYDPLGRVERTDFPDGTHARVERTPWLERSYDGNDTVLASAWHAARIALPGATPDELAQRRAAALATAHADTPTMTHADALGRAVRTIEDAGVLGQLETRVELDVVGNVLRVIDARGNLAESRTFGMLRQVLRTDSADAGWRRILFDAAGGVVRSWNARGFASRVVVDALRRGTHVFVTPPGGVEMLVTRTVWGEEVATAVADNLRGRVFRVYDGAGEHTNVRHDFAGNLLQQAVRLNRAVEGTQDWSGLGGASDPDAIAAIADASLEPTSFVATMQYDALRRLVSRTTPDGSETRTRFNEAGLLEAVDVRVRGAAEPSAIVTAVDYDARGQRLRCVHGNGTTASYAYEPDTFRLSRMRLVRASDDAVLQDLRYTYDPVGNIVEIRDGAQPRVFFDNDVVSADQRFEYDALYRLSSASGRELRSLSQPVDAEVAFSLQPHADDPAALRRYEETYAWDAVGNIVELRHTAAGGNFTRRYAYAPGGNRLLRNSAPGEAAEPFSHSYSYDEHGNMTGMPHLAAMAWDHADRLQHCDLGGGGEVWFVYDASGARVRKVQRNASGSRVRERVYLGEFELYRERAANDVAPELERQTLHVGDGTRRLCLVETLTVDDGEPVAAPVSVPRFQHGNHLDSASLELDGDAAVISYEEFHPFGTTSYAANDGAVEVSAKRYRYIGKERDEETGLYHLGARYYASWLGRWTAADPTGLADGDNRYAYCRGSPTTFRDVTGAARESVAGALVLHQNELTRAISEAGSPTIADALRDELATVTGELEQELADLARRQEGRDQLRRSDLSGRVRAAAAEATHGSMSTGTPTDAIDRAFDPRELQRAELAQMNGLGFIANGAFQKASVALEQAGVIEPMSDQERRIRGLSAGDLLDNVTGFSAPGGRTPSSRPPSPSRAPLKNRSGALNDAGRVRRTAPGASSANAPAGGPAPDAAEGGGNPSYQIIDGVRRSKAAEIAAQQGVGTGRISAQVVEGGRVTGTVQVEAGLLLSPKSSISTAGSGLDRWLSTLRQTLGGSKPPPIQVQRGSAGTPIRDVVIE